MIPPFDHPDRPIADRARFSEEMLEQNPNLELLVCGGRWGGFGRWNAIYIKANTS